jgi:cell wall-associated NlpC family hydrolase
MSAVRKSVGMPLPADHGWAILAQPPGVRDLGVEDYWQVSLERSLRRRNAPRRGRLVAAGGAPLSVALTAMAIGGAGTAAAATSGDLSLDRGATGPSVRTLQQALGVGADGVFGPKTEQAVKAYQASHGLPATGHVGPLTTQALGLGGTGAGTVRSSSGESADSTGATGDANSTGNDGGAAAAALSPDQVQAMQRVLGVSADGIVGPRTKAALRAFEAQHGLPADGVPDAAVLQALGTATPSPSNPSPTTPAAAPAAPSGVQAAVASAMTKIGSPYRAAAAGPNAFDCSGLVSWAMSQAGISVPRSSFAQFGVGSAVEKGSIQAGDLVFFDTAGAGASDVGIATSATTAVSATTHGVMTHPIFTGYWGSHYVGARRIA